MPVRDVLVADNWLLELVAEGSGGLGAQVECGVTVVIDGGY
jgi:hypothetical protein